ncbi:DUF6519 domain-containing protein [Alkalilimnicola ehrlichii MLHE-1]|uniref:EF-hand domain-containing protein n=1 Tax=Alkalilimnicola ehrlichii (strain ATCC BAA-1101 / DSM 17681 / MLHE-1) TaxID=187272 RepID=Q0A7U8_ALKEH|nr:DUF6519 domain-containing protein [Alkalilimnicola ehrlichii]ABI57089.1 hypothetical protein Mlg_1743 [Alkalilimnicola ehrlichii MLHE-1]
MKTQTSQPSHRDHGQYSGVYLQQGRMITDADWNALGEIGQRRLVGALWDAIASGAPREGGLRLSDDSGLRLHPGVLYVGGVPARLTGDGPLAPGEQPDYPDPPPFDGRDLTLYADVWERPVTALEDPALMDPALHGADTSSRGETLLQVKWCPRGLDPADPAVNPPLGDAPLALRLRHIVVGDDPCDPCASEMNLDERIGNYLFRVEVHDLFLDEAGERQLVLKWSRDNGAEAHQADNVPEGFDRGDWVWEFFDEASERTLGRHFPEDYRPRRGRLTPAFERPPEGEPRAFVRQWDGFLQLNLDRPALVSGVDRGAELDPELDPDAHGWAGIDAGVLAVNGERLELRLAFADRQFLPGDCWQAAVREAVQGPGDYVLGDEHTGEPPRGVRHRYLPLGELDGDGALVPHGDAERRRFNFPPLTDLAAADVGFSERCEALYRGAENVQQALDALCDIAAEHIAYRLPDCEGEEVTVKRLLAEALAERWPDIDRDGRLSVRDMLDGLLCHLDSAALPHDVPECRDGRRSLRERLRIPAGRTTTAEPLNRLLCDTTADHLPLGRETELCPDLDREGVETVQDALNTLCGRSGGGGCAQVVEPGELARTLKVLIEERRESIWLCLKPGVHEIPADLALHTARHIRISGGGYHACGIRLEGGEWALQAPQIQLFDLGIELPDDGESRVHLSGDDITLQRVHVLAREAEGGGGQRRPLLHIDGQLKEGIGLIRLEDCRLTPVDRGWALLLERVYQVAYIQNNHIDGLVRYRHGVGKPVDPASQRIDYVDLRSGDTPEPVADGDREGDTGGDVPRPRPGTGGGPVVRPIPIPIRDPILNRRLPDRVADAEGSLHVNNNFILRWTSDMESGFVRVDDRDRRFLARAVTGPAIFTVAQNTFGMRSSFIGGRLMAQGNQLVALEDDSRNTPALWLLCNQLVAHGHIGPGLEARHTAVDDAIGNNLMAFASLNQNGDQT